MKLMTLLLALILTNSSHAKDKKQYSISYSYLDLESSYFAGSEQYFSGEGLEFTYARKKEGKTFQLIHQFSTSFHSRNDDIINSSRGIKQVYDLSYKLKAGFSFLRLVAGTNAILLNAESFQKGDASLIWGGELTLNPLIIMEFLLNAAQFKFFENVGNEAAKKDFLEFYFEVLGQSYLVDTKMKGTNFQIGMRVSF